MDRRKRIALVTGATRGLGLAIVEVLAGLDHHVLLTGRDVEKGCAEAGSFQRKGFDVRFLELDVCHERSAENLALVVRDQYGALDVIVNNAAVCLEDWSSSALMDCLEVNLFGAVRTVSCLGQLLGEDACIVNVSSGDGESVWLSTAVRERFEKVQSTKVLLDVLRELAEKADSLPSQEVVHGEQPTYKVSKFALNCYTRLLHNDLNESGIRVLAVCPGDVRTGMNPSASRCPSDAAKAIVELVVGGPSTYQSGGFYRDCEIISW
uniref:Uncharacterized protein n=1 Tax=Rhodosorus marinus TaxID=101924 RepID=A0A7S0BP00_9RHOD|mmetsp:Transcript_2688/g.3908  ORF Transcript_2688/g.3908 Transcript_2688/m.3908 type:complete len:265 (+) Transcript_2688:263-1057(+)